MSEHAKRLTPTGDTLRELFLKSGNLCAFPGCVRLMMNADGVFVGQICHIEAAEHGGERFNETMTNEDRRLPRNLMLMCYEHHVVTNDVEEYSVDRLRAFKADHEARFASPQRAILATLQDWTRADDPILAVNLRRLGAVLGWDLNDDDLAGTALILNRYVDHLRVVPVELRDFIGKLAERCHRVKATSAAEISGDSLLLSCRDIESAFNLSSKDVSGRGVELDTYGLGGIDRLQHSEFRVPAIRVNALDGWQFWGDLAKFCEQAGVSMEAFTHELNFSSLDE